MDWPNKPLAPVVPLHAGAPPPGPAPALHPFALDDSDESPCKPKGGRLESTILAEIQALRDDFQTFRSDWNKVQAQSPVQLAARCKITQASRKQTNGVASPSLSDSETESPVPLRCADRGETIDTLTGSNMVSAVKPPHLAVPLARRNIRSATAQSVLKNVQARTYSKGLTSASFNGMADSEASAKSKEGIASQKPTVSGGLDSEPSNNPEATGIMSRIASTRTDAAMWRASLRTFVNSSVFDVLSLSAVVGNSVTIGLQTDYLARNLSEPTMGYRAVDAFFCVVFTAELALRVVTLGKEFFRSDRIWSLFDCVLVGMQLMDEVMTSLAFDFMGSRVNLSFLRCVRILRLVRILRVIRILRLIGELRTIVSSIIGSLRSLVWTILLLLMLVYVFGLCFTQLVLDHRLGLAMEGIARSEEDEILEQHFGSLGSSIFSLYMGITGGMDWGDLAQPLMNRVSVFLGGVLTLYTAFATLALLNVVTGVFVESALKSATQDRNMYMLHHIKELFKACELDEEGNLSWEVFEEQLDNPSMKEFFKSIDVDVSEARAIFTLLDGDDSGRIDLDEFLNGCLALHGPATALHLSTLMYETRAQAKCSAENLKSVAKILGDIAGDGRTEVQSPKQLSTASRPMRHLANEANGKTSKPVGRQASRMSRQDSTASSLLRRLL